MKVEKKVLLSIAGYDPSAGAGALLDVSVFRRFGFAGTAILTAVTAQNTQGVEEMRCLAARFLNRQHRTLVKDFAIAGIKVGMIGCRKNIPALGRILAEHADIPIVVDPVFRSSSGRWLLERKAVPEFALALRGRLSLLTPNLDEAELIARYKVRDLNGMKEAAARIFDLVGAPCLVKGGHLEKRAVDALFDGRRCYLFKGQKINRDVRGTGCFLSSTLLCYLVKGYSLPEACALASAWTRRAIRKSVRLGKGRAVFSI
jgi:hydroxymethylpyrimidine kinase/phosphomethylpyrimidine kinase